MPLDALYQLLCRIFRHIGQHHVPGLRFGVDDGPDGAADQLLLEEQEKIPFLLVPAATDQMAADAVPELLSAVAIAYQARIQLEHAAQQIGDGLAHHCLFLLGQQVFPLFYRFAAYDHMVLDQCMSNQPACTYAEEMLDGGLGITCQLPLVLQGREHTFPEVPVDALMGFKSGVIYGGHIGFLIRKMLDSVVFKVLYRLLAGKVAFLFLISEIEQLIENAEKLFVFFVDDVHSQVIPFIPYQTIFHMSSSLKCRDCFSFSIGISQPG